MTRPTRERAIPSWIPTLVEVVLIAVFVRYTWEIPSDDFWWHLACGRRILENGGLPPACDPLTIVSSGHPWIAHEWLWELWAWVTSRLGGAGLVLWVKGLTAMATLALTLRMARQRGVAGTAETAATLVIAGVGLESGFFDLRPQSVTVLATTLVTVIGWDWLGRGKDRLWLVPPLMAVWANAHGGFICGLLALCTFLGGQLFRAWRGEAGATGRASRLAVVLLLAVAACCVTPYGPAHLLYPISIVGDPYLMASIEEWERPALGNTPVLWALLGLAAIVLVRARARLEPEEVLQLALTVPLLLQARRTWFVVIPWAAPALGACIQHIVARGWPERARAPGPGEHRSLLAWGVAVLMLAGFWGREEFRFEPGFEFPGAQLEAIATLPSHVELFNDYLLGGLVEYRLHPRRPFIDGRADLHMASGGLRKYHRIARLQPGWADLFFGAYRLEAALLGRRSALAGELRRRGWHPAVEGKAWDLLLAPGVRAGRVTGRPR